MAPNDSAFSNYLADQGLNSIEEMDSSSLEKLIGFHLMYYAYSADKLINFRPQEGDDVTDEEKKINAGMYYKHRTKSKDPIQLSTTNAPDERDVIIRSAFACVLENVFSIPND
jgi:hypothetical protein